jgi:hypothetical protein
MALSVVKNTLEASKDVMHSVKSASVKATITPKKARM